MGAAFGVFGGAARMKRMTYSGDRANWSVFAGLVVYGNHPLRLYAVSMVGSRSATRSLQAAIRTGKKVSLGSVAGLEWDGNRSRYATLLETEKSQYDAVAKVLDQAGEGLVHIMLTHKSARTADGKGLMLCLDTDGKPMPATDAFLREWRRRYAVPVLSEWIPWLWAQAKRTLNAASEHMVTPLSVYHDPAHPVEAYWLNMQDKDLESLVTLGLRLGKLSIPDGPDAEGATLAGVTDVTTYMTRFSKVLSRRIREQFIPLHEPTSPREPLLDRLAAPLYPAQEQLVQSEAKGLAAYGVAMIGAEQGTGKTRMGGALPVLLHKGMPFRWLVMAPSHLVDVWVDELRVILPGAESTIIETVGELERYVARHPRRPTHPEFVIISKERMKLGSLSRPAVLYGRRPTPDPKGAGLLRNSWQVGPLCPRCGTMQVDKEGNPLPADAFDAETEANRFCQHCNEVLWTKGFAREQIGTVLQRPAGWRGPVQVLRRVALADYLKRKLKHWADGLIIDEIHDMKGDTAQGNAMGAVAAAVRYVVGLSGTLSSGYAHDLFRLLYRMRPTFMKGRDYPYSTRGMTRFTRDYGRMERVQTVTTDQDAVRNATSNGKKTRTTLRARPGISPRAFGDFLLPFTAFLELADLGHALPPYTEVVELVQMERDLEAAYEQLQTDLKAAVGHLLHKGGSKRLLGAYLQALLHYPNRPWSQPDVVDKETGKIVAVPPELPKRYDRRKVQRLAETCLAERRAGRRSLVFATATDTRDLQPWLAEVLRDAGLRVAIMYGRQVPPRERLRWMRNQVRMGVDVIICNPILVQTGLTLLDFPTIVWFQPSYSLFTLRQASRRSWRIGQTQPVKVIFMAYQGTLEETALQLLGRKMEAALALEGRFSEEGLQALADDHDMTTSLARALVKGLDDSVTAEDIWRRMNDVQVASGAFRPLDLSAVPAATVDPVEPTQPWVAVDAGTFFGRSRRKGGDAEQLAFLLE